MIYEARRTEYDVYVNQILSHRGTADERNDEDKEILNKQTFKRWPR